MTYQPLAAFVAAPPLCSPLTNSTLKPKVTRGQGTNLFSSILRPEGRFWKRENKERVNIVISARANFQFPTPINCMREKYPLLSRNKVMPFETR